MVVFSCNNCGDTVKKNKVEAHFQMICRIPVLVSCLDCLEDFRGSEYEAHTKCITESEKYSAKGFVPKPSSNKGERKQQEWLNVVKSLLEDESVLDKTEFNLVNILSQHENVPRKKKQFINFLKSTARNFSPATVDHVWEMLDKKLTAIKQEKGLPEDKEKNGTGNEDVPPNSTEVKSNEVEKVENLTKKERKEKRKREKYEAELREIENKPSEEIASPENGEQKKKKKKKSKKAKENGEENGVDIEETKAVKEPKKRLLEEAVGEEVTVNKKRKKGLEENVVIQDSHNTTDDDIKPSKFKWEDTILKILKTKGELSLKRLRKKVLNEYQNSGCTTEASMDKAIAKFNKKLLKVSHVEVTKEVARLIS